MPSSSARRGGDKFDAVYRDDPAYEVVAFTAAAINDIAGRRYPMPYGDLACQAVQRFATHADIAAANCTIEEREKYEPHLAARNIVYAGVDYAWVLALAQSTADVILRDGGNNGFPFIKLDLHIVLVDPLRPGHEDTHYPGEAVLRMADAIVVAKNYVAAPADVRRVFLGARNINPRAAIVRARYDFAEAQDSGLNGIVGDYLRRIGLLVREE